MKILFIECNAEEMKANRTFMYALTDAVRNIVDTLNSPITDGLEQEPEKDEEQKGEE